LERVVATDRYTVQFKFKQPNIFEIYDILVPSFGMGQIQAPEWAKQYGTDFSKASPGGGPPPGGPGGPGGGPPPTISADWKNVVGTGPWMLTDAVAGSSLTYSKNPNYFGHDERYPQNQLPYIDTFKELAIPDMATAIAALRTGKVDMIAEGRFGPTWQDAQALAKTNPEIQQALWSAPGATIELRVDHKPYTDIRVRQALQMAIDRPSIAKSYYGGTVDGKPAGLSSPFNTGWVTPYDQWPNDLKQIYSFNADQAKKLLADAGYPQGFSTECVAANMDDLQVLTLLKAEFHDVGVEMSINAMDMPTEAALLSTGKNDQMDFTMASGTFTIPSQAILTYYSQYKDNHGHVNDPNYDALVSQFQAAKTMDDAKPIFIQADTYAFQQCWALQVCPIAAPLFWQPYLHGYSGEQQQGEMPGFYAARMWLTK
jgi:peptide/nickel transport system substrate-binding protein